MPPKLRKRSTGAAARSPATNGEEGHTGSKSSETSPAASGRWTRARARDLGFDTTDHPRVSDSAGGGGRTDRKAPAGAAPKKRKGVSASTSAGPVPRKTTAAGRKRRNPPCPSLPPGQCTKLDQRDIPTLRDEPRDPLTADAVVSSQDKAMVLRVARSVVSVSSITPDGGLIFQCTGIVFGWDGANKCAKILTSSSVVCDFKGELHDPTLKLSVHLPDNTITEGRLLSFNVHYDVALLEVMGDFQLQVPSFGSSTTYGQDVFALARDENMCLMVRHGKISWLECPMLLNNHYMFLSCDIPEGGSGGPVIDHDGNIIGIVFDNNPGPVVTSITTIRTCVEMWHQFSRVARPILGMQLKAVELLDVSKLEELCLDNNITSGFIVNLVKVDSIAERLGIRRGDVIVFQDSCCSTLPQLEDYLLSLGWGYLQGKSLTVDLKS
ncbi:hypothetical protein DAI22_08g029800 [Oryza sativa Japonica Group]|nr:hypothetical protein DAI22_08g029800 [Oryza sativa Japonica Group]KAF2918069.1 hypothetical protein DAI22_08g029800 [Oryza sativa Japonica Group]